MKKMIASDFLIARQSLPAQMALSVAVGLFCGVVMGGPLQGGCISLAVFAFSYCLGLSLWDEQNDWHSMRLAMPFSRREIVTGRYCSALLFLAIGIACGAVSGALSAFAMKLFMPEALSAAMADFGGAAGALGGAAGALATGGSGSLPSFFQAAGLAILLIASVILIYCAIQYPLGFRFGMEKAGRLLPLCFVALLFGLIAIGNFVDLGGVFEDLFMSSSAVTLFLCVFAVALLLYAASCVLSVRLYEKRSF